jgi:hypothetical protein
MPLSVGTKLGLYEIVAPLGTGGSGSVWGEVYRANDIKLKREVTVKVLPDSSANFGANPDGTSAEYEARYPWASGSARD